VKERAVAGDRARCATGRVVVALALAACGGGASAPSDSSPPPPVDHPPAWNSFSWQYRSGYGVLTASATDPDGTATSIACVGTIGKTYTNSALDSVALPQTGVAQTENEACNATSNGLHADTQTGSFTIPAIVDSVNEDVYRIDARTGQQIPGAATLTVGTDKFTTTDGHFVVREPANSVITLYTVVDTNAFAIDRIEDASGNIVGMNWPALNGVPLDLSKANGPYKIKELSDEPGANPALTYNKITYPSYAQAFPSNPVPVIPIIMAIQPKKDTLCDDADAATLQTLITAANEVKATLDSLSDQNPQDTVLYKRTVVEMDSVPLVNVTINGNTYTRPARGYQLICQENSFGSGGPGAFNSVFADPNTGEIISGIAQISPGYPISNAKGEIYPLHVGKLQDGPFTDPNNYTFYIVGLSPTADLLPADKDLFRFGTVPFSREGMLKFLQNGKNDASLYPAIKPQ
jgi:hypothetical protein